VFILFLKIALHERAERQEFSALKIYIQLLTFFQHLCEWLWMDISIT